MVPVLKIAVMSDGSISVDGHSSTIELVRESLKGLAEKKGSVLYYREGGEGDASPQAIKIIEAIVENRLPVRLSSKPDYSDVVGPDGKPIASST